MNCVYHNDVHPLASSALTRFAPNTEYVETRGLFGYGEAIRARWTGESDLVVVEADKEILADTLPSFEACDQLWCTTKCKTFPPPHTRITTNSLACAKFSAEIQRIVDPSEFICPDPFWAPCRKCDSRGCWNQLDTRMAIAIGKHANGMPHVHGEVLHHHVYDDEWLREWKLDYEFAVETQARMLEFSSVEEIMNYGH